MSILDDLISDQRPASPSPAPTSVATAPAVEPQEPKPSGNILDDLLASAPPSHSTAVSGGESIPSDVAKSIVAAVPKGIAQGLGTPGDIQSFATSDYNPFNYMARKFAEAYPEWAAHSQKLAERAGLGEGMTGETQLPTSKQIRSGVETVTGPLHEPETLPGKIAGTTTEFVTNPLSYIGVASIPLKVATAATSGAASELAGQATEGLGPLETASRLLAGAMGGHIPNAVSRSIARSALRNAATTDDLFNSSAGLYQNAYGSGVTIRPQIGRDWANDITSELRSDGFRPYTEATRAAFRTIRELGTTFNNQGTLGIVEVDTVRKALNRIAGGADREARAIARFGISKIDENISNLASNPRWLQTGHANAAQVASDITQARATYAAAMRSNMLEDAFDSAMEKADRRRSSTGKGGNFENTMRQEIRKIIDSPVRRRGFSDDEVKLMDDIVRGRGDARNLLRGISALAPTGIVSGTLGLELGHMLFGGLKGIFGVPIVGLAAKHIGERQTAKRIEDVAAMTRMRGSGAPMPRSYTPAHGYMAPLLGSQMFRRGGRAAHHAVRIAKKFADTSQ